ncbi:MAG TPA: LacI family DNA-binding transcriptional regulator [Spirochaetia bacterium]|nr:LacI family DNA-binding transcriptional regulator [Spirochaetia bacterium]
MKKNDPPTITEIARRAKVSIGTVDRVVHNRGRVAAKTAARVQKIIKELGYKPNIFASHLSRARVYQFGVVLPLCEQDSCYWRASVAGIEQAVTELNHYRVKVRYFFYDRYKPEEFKKLETKILSAGLDGILVAPVLHQPVRALIEKMPRHIPYVFVNTTIRDLHPLSFIGQDSTQSGLVCGKLMSLYIRRPSTIAVILSVPDDPHIRQRADGFKAAFPDGSGVTVREYELFDLAHHEKSAPLAARILKENPDLQGVFVANVAVHYLAEALQKKLRSRHILVIGYDLIEPNVSLLKTNAITFLISQKPERQGYEGVYALYRHIALREKSQKKILMPIDIITSENVKYYTTR